MLSTSNTIGPCRDVAFSGHPGISQVIVETLKFDLKWDLQGASVPSVDQVISRMSVIHQNQVISSFNGHAIQLLCAQFGLPWKLDESGCCFDIPGSFDHRIDLRQYGLQVPDFHDLQVFWSNQLDQVIKCQSAQVSGQIRDMTIAGPSITSMSTSFSTTQVRALFNPPISPQQLDAVGIHLREDVDTKNLQVCIYSSVAGADLINHDWSSHQVKNYPNMAWFPVKFPLVEWVTVCISGLPQDKSSLLTVVCKWQ